MQNAFLVNTRGRRPFLVTLVLIPEKGGAGKLWSFQLNTITDPLAQMTRLGSVEIVLADESDREQLEGFTEKRDMDGFLAWLQKGQQTEPAPEQTPAPPPEPEPDPQPPEEETHESHERRGKKSHRSHDAA